ncbi:hypothetical protein ACNKHS_11030 [Shigella flexneri]
MKLCPARVIPLFPVYDGKTHRLTIEVVGRGSAAEPIIPPPRDVRRRGGVLVGPHKEQYTWILKLLKTRKPAKRSRTKRKELFPGSRPSPEASP